MKIEKCLSVSLSPLPIHTLRETEEETISSREQKWVSAERPLMHFFASFHLWKVLV